MHPSSLDTKHFFPNREKTNDHRLTGGNTDEPELFHCGELFLNIGIRAIMSETYKKCPNCDEKLTGMFSGSVVEDEVIWEINEKI